MQRSKSLFSSVARGFKEKTRSFGRHHHWDLHTDIQTDTHSYAACEQQPHDMTLPLSCYFISSGHNSYLTGNQLSSDSGTKVIIDSLKKACRVIELDVYNEQKPDTGPVCKHGGTMTKPILFKTCVEAIRDYAFTASQYPVIITIENHTDNANQIMMANILLDVLGELLYIPDESDIEGLWKSPQDLKGKILMRTKVNDSWAPELARLIYIKNVKLHDLQEANNSTRTTSCSIDEKAAKKLMKRAFTGSGLPAKPPEPASFALRNFAPSKSGDLGSQNPKDTFIVDSLLKEDKKTLPKKTDSTRKALQEVKKAKDEGEGISKEIVGTVQSLGDAYAYTSRHLMRVYPAIKRVNSSNYNPARAWSLGASIVALNWQTNDKPLWINQAMFMQQNKGCGYLLKPSWMRNMAEQLGPLKSIPENPIPDRDPFRLQITVYNAYCKQSPYHFLWLKDDLYVQMMIYGIPIDWQSQRTHTAQDSDKLVVEKAFHFMVHYPETAVLVITLMDEDHPGAGDDLLGHWEAPLATLKQGDFILKLTDRKGRPREDRWIKLNFEWQVMEDGILSPVGDALPILNSSFEVSAKVSVPEPPKVKKFLSI